MRAIVYSLKSQTIFCTGHKCNCILLTLQKMLIPDFEYFYRALARIFVQKNN